jgi:hypothetical protein
MGKRFKVRHRTKFRSKVPPPSWDQVAWLIGGGILHLVITFFMSLYNAKIETRETVSRFDEIFGAAYSLMIFLGLISISAIVLGLVKIILLIRLRIKEKRN